MDATTTTQTDLISELAELTRLDGLRCEKLLAEEHRRVAALAGQLEHYGFPEAAQKVLGALWGLTAAGMEVTLTTRRLKPSLAPCAYPEMSDADDDTTAA